MCQSGGRTGCQDPGADSGAPEANCACIAPTALLAELSGVGELPPSALPGGTDGDLLALDFGVVSACMRPSQRLDVAMDDVDWPNSAILRFGIVMQRHK